MSSFTIDAILGSQLKQQRVPALPTDTAMSAFLPLSAPYLGLPQTLPPHDAFLPFGVNTLVLEHLQRQQQQQFLLRAYQQKLVELEASKLDNHDSRIYHNSSPDLKRETAHRTISSPLSEAESHGTFIISFIALLKKSVSQVHLTKLNICIPIKSYEQHFSLALRRPACEELKCSCIKFSILRCNFCSPMCEEAAMQHAMQANFPTTVGS